MCSFVAAVMAQRQCSYIYKNIHIIYIYIYIAWVSILQCLLMFKTTRSIENNKRRGRKAFGFIVISLYESAYSIFHHRLISHVHRVTKRRRKDCDLANELCSMWNIHFIWVFFFKNTYIYINSIYTDSIYTSWSICWWKSVTFSDNTNFCIVFSTFFFLKRSVYWGEFRSTKFLILWTKKKKKSQWMVTASSNELSNTFISWSKWNASGLFFPIWSKYRVRLKITQLISARLHKFHSIAVRIDDTGPLYMFNYLETLILDNHTQGFAVL